VQIAYVLLLLLLLLLYLPCRCNPVQAVYLRQGSIFFRSDKAAAAKQVAGGCCIVLDLILTDCDPLMAFHQ
jgi:hypothetical protein